MTTAAGASRERIQHRWRTARILAAAGPVLVVAGWGLLIAGKHVVGMPMVVVGMALSALGFTFLGSFERLSLARMVQDLPTTRIRSAPQGYMEIAGIVRAGSTLISCPECGLRCCWFQIQRKGKTRITPASAADVVVEDGTGRCLLCLAGAELISTRRNEGRHAHLIPGDPVHVLGEFRTGSASGPLPGAPAPAGLAIESVESNRAELVRRKLQWLKYTRPKAEFDVNRDGRLDARELEAMARVAGQMVARDEAQGAAAPPRPDSTMGKPRGETDLPFLVVVGTEREALRALRRGALYYAVSTLLTLGVLSAILRDISASQLKDRENIVEFLSKPDAPRVAPKPAVEEPAPRPVPVRTPRQQAGDLHRANRLEEAVAAYDALLLDDPYDGEVAFWRANALGQLGRQEEAVAGLQGSCDLGHSEACEMLRARFPDAARP